MACVLRYCSLSSPAMLCALMCRSTAYTDWGRVQVPLQPWPYHSGWPHGTFFWHEPNIPLVLSLPVHQNLHTPHTHHSVNIPDILPVSVVALLFLYPDHKQIVPIGSSYRKRPSNIPDGWHLSYH